MRIRQILPNFSGKIQIGQIFGKKKYFKKSKSEICQCFGEPNESRCISLLYQGIVFEAAYTFLKGRLKNLFFLAELGPPEVGSRSYNLILRALKLCFGSKVWS